MLSLRVSASLRAAQVDEVFARFDTDGGGYLDMDEKITAIKTEPIGAGEGEFSELALVDVAAVESPRGAPRMPRMSRAICSVTSRW